MALPDTTQVRTVSSAPSSNKPKAETVVTNATIIYSKTHQQIATLVGGKTALNIYHEKNTDGQWHNLCAVRLSWILNQSGHRIPFINSNTTSTGKDNHRYIWRLTELRKYLRSVWGEPLELTSNADLSTIRDKVGVMIFTTNNSANFTGHATIWNKTKCMDSTGNAFTSSISSAEPALFWEL